MVTVDSLVINDIYMIFTDFIRISNNNNTFIKCQTTIFRTFEGLGDQQWLLVV